MNPINKLIDTLILFIILFTVGICVASHYLDLVSSIVGTFPVKSYAQC